METNALPTGQLVDLLLIPFLKSLAGYVAKYGVGVAIAFGITAWAKHAFPFTARGKKIFLPFLSVLAGIAFQFTVEFGALLSDPNSKIDVSRYFIFIECMRGLGVGIAASLIYMVGGYKIEKWAVSKIKKP